MKIKEIVVGSSYYTKVGGGRVKVKVLSTVEPTPFSKQTRFRVQREDNGRALDKPRTASALHSHRSGPDRPRTGICGPALSQPLEQALANSDRAKANEVSWDAALPSENDANDADSADSDADE